MINILRIAAAVCTIVSFLQTREVKAAARKVKLFIKNKLR